MRALTGFAPHFVLFLVFRHRHGIDAGKPAIEIDIGAAPRAEWTGRFGGGLAANRTKAARSFRHEPNMGRPRRRANSYSALSQPKWIG
jgi:hypothetical protein